MGIHECERSVCSSVCRLPNAKGGEKRIRGLNRPARNLKCLSQGQLGHMPDKRLPDNSFSINRPNARRGQFDQMAVRVSKVEAPASQFPFPLFFPISQSGLE